MNMIKRLSILMLVVLATAGIANAQFRFGVKAGVNLNKLDLKNPIAGMTSDNGCGFTGGVMTEFQVPIVGLCFDLSLMYTRMNSEVSNLVDGEIASNEARNFFQIPLNIKYKIQLPIVKPYIFTGPDFAFKLGGSDDVFKTKAVQTAWNIGAGVELFDHLQVSGSYALGMNDIFDKSTLDKLGLNKTDNIKLKNNYWTVTAAWLF